MRLKPSEIIAAGAFAGWFMSQIWARNAKLRRGLKWLFGMTCALAILAVVWPFSDKEGKSNNQSQTTRTSGNNSPAANQSATASGNGSTVIQAATGSTINTTVNSGIATNPAVEGNLNTVVGDVSQSINGNGNTIVGATDNHGNTLVTQSMAIGFNAHAGAGSIAIGANAGAGNITQIVGENNGGNVAQLNNSPNAKVNQSIVNQYAGQEFLGTRVDSTNDPVPIDPGGIYAGYKTQFSAFVKGEVGKVQFLMTKFPPSVIEFRQYYAGHQTIDANMEPAPYTVTFYTIIVITTSKIDPSDFGFSVTNIP